MAERGWEGNHPPYEVGPRLALLLDLSLTSGRSPSCLLGDLPEAWTELDLEVLSQWKAIPKCPGCGRPMSVHSHSRVLGREEEPGDYSAFSWSCPAQQSIAAGQAQWSKSNSGAVKAYHDGHGPDPMMGVYWLAQGPTETLPDDIQ